VRLTDAHPQHEAHHQKEESAPPPALMQPQEQRQQEDHARNRERLAQDSMIPYLNGGRQAKSQNGAVRQYFEPAVLQRMEESPGQSQPGGGREGNLKEIDGR